MKLHPNTVITDYQNAFQRAHGFIPAVVRKGSRYYVNGSNIGYFLKELPVMVERMDKRFGKKPVEPKAEPASPPPTWRVVRGGNFVDVVTVGSWQRKEKMSPRITFKKRPRYDGRMRVAESYSVNRSGRVVARIQRQSDGTFFWYFDGYNSLREGISFADLTAAKIAVKDAVAKWPAEKGAA